MEIKRKGKRGTLFTFYDLGGIETNTYMINGNKYIFILDTFLGPESMEEVKKYIVENYEPKPYIIFNSHFHWDHIWGNCAFDPEFIISHVKCLKLIEEHGEEELREFERYKKGEVNLIYPNLTFNESLLFEEEGVEFYYTPGHTADSASVFDRSDNVLFAGDNIERPIPYLSWENIDVYIKTIQNYLSCGYNNIIAGHCSNVDKELLEETLVYLKKFKEGDTREYEAGEYKEIHSINAEMIKVKL